MEPSITNPEIQLHAFFEESNVDVSHWAFLSQSDPLTQTKKYESENSNKIGNPDRNFSTYLGGVLYAFWPEGKWCKIALYRKIKKTNISLTKLTQIYYHYKNFKMD